MTLYGLGIGWRPEVSGIIAQLDGLAFCEVIAESVGNEIPPHLGSLGVPVIPHGISLSLGGAEAVDQARIDHLARASQLLGAPLASEHIAFVRAGGIEAGHLLPLPRTYEAVDALVRNITRTQDGLPVPFAVENVAALFDWPDDELTEGEFLALRNRDLPRNCRRRRADRSAAPDIRLAPTLRPALRSRDARRNVSGLRL